MLRLHGYIVLLFTLSLLQAQIKQGKNYFDSDSTQASEIYHYSIEDSLIHGAYESFYLNGSLKSYGWFKENRPDSLWEYYYENGSKKGEGRFWEGIPDGEWKYYYENGNIKSEGILRGNSKYGFWRFYYENNCEKSNGEYEGDQKIGIWNYLYECGSLKAQTVIENGVGSYIEFYPSGSRRMEGENKDERSEGEWIYYYETGEIEAVGHYKSGLKTGEWTYYHKTGQKSAKGSYQSGNRNGEWIYYHENGKVSQQGNLINDEKDGFWKLFYPTGEVLGEAQYEQDDGFVNEYYPSGKQKAKGRIIHGEKNGKWYYYNEIGDLEGEADLINGSGEYIGYYSNGTVKMKGQIEKDKRVGEWPLFDPVGVTVGTYQTVYENKPLIFKKRFMRDLIEKESFAKPDYHSEKRRLRYFLPRMNEYKGFIIATNPAWLAGKQLPIAIEYYIQERMGYEIQLDILRNPFFKNHNHIGDYQVYASGIKIHFRQKFYHTDSKYGMVYFGHEVNFTYLNRWVNHTDTLIIQQPRRFGSLKETSYGYGIFVGNRWMKDVGTSGFTIDLFLGVGVAVRSFDKKYRPLQVLDNYFDKEIKSSFYLPIIIGLNVGFALTKSKSETQ